MRRYSLTTPDRVIADLALAIDADALPIDLARPRYNIAPMQQVPVVVLRDGARTIAAMRWGMLAPWRGHGGARGPMLFNAQLEGVDAKPTFRDAFRRRRCLIPADGFFEWRADHPKKHPMWFRRDDHRVFAVAAIWATHADDDQPSIATLTTTPNALIAPIHDRMPIVIEPHAYAAWLDPRVSPDRARALCTPVPVAGWRADAVAERVNSVAHDDAACVAPADGAPPAQLRLL